MELRVPAVSDRRRSRRGCPPSRPRLTTPSDRPRSGRIAAADRGPGAWTARCSSPGGASTDEPQVHISRQPREHPCARARQGGPRASAQPARPRHRVGRSAGATRSGSRDVAARTGLVERGLRAGARDRALLNDAPENDEGLTTTGRQPFFFSSAWSASALAALSYGRPCGASSSQRGERARGRSPHRGCRPRS